MSDFYLRVPFSDNDAVRKLGARWNPVVKAWCVPEGVDPVLFAEWLAPPPDINVRSSRYLLASSEHRCHRCHKMSAVHGFMLPIGHEALNVGDTEAEDEWEYGEDPTLLSHIEYLSPTVATRIATITPFYKLAFTADQNECYYSNFCDYCHARFNDHQLFAEPGEGFVAFCLEDAKRVQLLDVSESFAAQCNGLSIGIALFEDMTYLAQQSPMRDGGKSPSRRAMAPD
jgi:hypothetical protein